MSSTPRKHDYPPEYDRLRALGRKRTTAQTREMRAIAQAVRTRVQREKRAELRRKADLAEALQSRDGVARGEIAYTLLGDGRSALDLHDARIRALGGEPPQIGETMTTEPTPPMEVTVDRSFPSSPEPEPPPTAPTAPLEAPPSDAARKAFGGSIRFALTIAEGLLRAQGGRVPPPCPDGLEISAEDWGAEWLKQREQLVEDWTVVADKFGWLAAAESKWVALAVASAATAGLYYPVVAEIRARRSAPLTAHAA